MIDLSILNANQREAVDWKDGALLVLGGPGSGKTRVLTSRIVRILEESEGAYFRILALTFTNKAAAEMRERVHEHIPGGLNRVRLTTFHSFAAELLQQHGSHIGIRPDFQILSNDTDREVLLDDVLGRLQKDLTHPLPVHFKSSGLLPAITRLLEQCVASENAEFLLDQSNVENASSLARVYAGYRDGLSRTNTLDFPSLIAESIRLLEKIPFIAKHIRKVYTHILVDEFQDTNDPQYQMLSLLAQCNPSTFFIVADDDQIIYQWNGAVPARIQKLRDDFDVSELQLPENYRCPPLIIKLANALISKNLNRSAGKQPLRAIREDEDENVLRIRHFDNLDAEVAWVAADIAKKSERDRSRSVVLARTRRVLEEAGKKLQEAGLSVYYSLRKSEFTSAPLRMLHAILRLVIAREDTRSLARLSKAFFELEGIRIEPASLIARASVDDKDLLTSWSDAVRLRDNAGKSTLNLLENDIKPLLNQLNYRDFADSLFRWAEESLMDDEGLLEEFQEERAVWERLLSEITRKFGGETVGLHQLLHELDLSSKELPKPPDAISCFTIHASKGLEFEHVYIIGLVEDQLPGWAAVKRGNNSIEMQEERRNCFVALTRTQESLTLTYSKVMFGRIKSPSRFLSEMGIAP